MTQPPPPPPPLSPTGTPPFPAAGTAADRVLTYASTLTVDPPTVHRAVRCLRLSAIGLALAALLLGGILFALFVLQDSVPRTFDWLALLKISPSVAFLFAWAVAHWFLAGKVVQGPRLFVQIAFALAILLLALLLLAALPLWVFATWDPSLLPLAVLALLGATISLDLVIALGELLFGPRENPPHHSPVSPPPPASLLPPPPHTTSPPPPSRGAAG